MPRLLLAPLVALLLVPCARADAGPPRNAPAPLASLPAALPCDPPPSLACAAPPTRCWAEGEFLLWWVRDGNLPFTAVTTGTPASLGILGLDGTRVVRGSESFDYGTFNGMRFTAGTWFTDTSACGFEGSAFLLEQRQDGFSAATGSDGAPLLARPFTDAATNAGSARLLAFPGAASGGLDVASSSRLWGAEANLVARLCESGCVTVTGLAGFRYLELEEDLEFRDHSRVTSPLVTTSFNGGSAVAPATTIVEDQFGTRNQFYGGQLGAKVSYASGKFGVDVTGKCAMGVAHQVLTKDGSSTLIGGGPAAATVPGGLFVQSTNVGRFADDFFTVVPEAAVKLRYEVARGVSFTAGYTWLFVSRVVRPGDQVDRRLNPNLVPTSPTFGLPGGPPLPSQRFDRSNFDAHGVSLGVNVAF